MDPEVGSLGEELRLLAAALRASADDPDGILSALRTHLPPDEPEGEPDVQRIDIT